MPTFGQKNVNSVKNTHYGPKKSIGCHFFSIFSRKNYCLMPIYIFKNKNVHSLITHYSHANILSKKRPFSQKHCALMSIKKKIMKNPLLSCLYLIKKRQFCQNNTILWAKEVSRMPFFCDFSRKNYRSYAHILCLLL